MIQYVIAIIIFSGVSSCPDVPIKIFIQGAPSQFVALAVSLCLSLESCFFAPQVHTMCFGFLTASVYLT